MLCSVWHCYSAFSHLLAFSDYVTHVVPLLFFANLAGVPPQLRFLLVWFFAEAISSVSAALSLSFTLRLVIVIVIVVPIVITVIVIIIIIIVIIIGVRSVITVIITIITGYINKRFWSWKYKLKSTVCYI